MMNPATFLHQDSDFFMKKTEVIKPNSGFPSLNLITLLEHTIKLIYQLLSTPLWLAPLLSLSTP